MFKYSIPNLTDEIFSERFNQIDDFFSKLTGKIPFKNFPNYNIKKLSNNKFEIVISIPGFTINDISITTTKTNLLCIKSKKIFKNKEEYIHKGIIEKNFNLYFNIGNFTKVENATLKNGLLNIFLSQEILEEENLNKINIEEK